LVAILKNTTRERASTIVVIKGLAITAGSKPTLLATKGKSVPTNFANTMAIKTVKETTKQIVIVTSALANNILSTRHIFIKFAIDREITITVADADYEVSTSADKITLMIGDLSGDNRVDNTDLNAVKSIFGKNASDEDGYSENADINADDRIDNTDLNAVKSTFGKSMSDYEAL
jgi:hypothetical protein